MSGDYESLEINQPKISYLKKRSNDIIRFWKIWKYALGSFADTKTQRYDNLIVLVRSFIFLTYLITNCFIISGVIRHWNNVPTQRLPVQHQSIQEEHSR